MIAIAISRQRRTIFASALVLAAACLAWLMVAPAFAAQQPNANAYAYWNLAADGGIWNVDQNVEIRQTAASTFWAGAWQWSNVNPSGGGYFGLQENGMRFDGTTGSTAIFSIWNANGKRGGSCGKFDGEGSGYSCRMPFTIRTHRLYRLRLWRQQRNVRGQWWGAWIKDQASGKEQFIGGLRAPPNATAVSSYVNFTEYFGPAVPTSDRVPPSVADYTQPAANQQAAGKYQAAGVFRGSTVGGGTTGTVGSISLGWTNAARITMGGPTDSVAPPAAADVPASAGPPAVVDMPANGSPTAPDTASLEPDQALGSGQSLWSATGYALTMQDDGNLVVIAPGNHPVWTSRTSKHPGAIARMQGDGNLVVIAPGNRPVWSSGTSGYAGAIARMQRDGNLVVIAPGNHPVWATGTAGR